MSTDRQKRSAVLHGEALLAAQHPQVEALAAQLWREGDLLTETGGVIAGSWFARPTCCIGHELIAAGLLLTGPIERTELEHWLGVGMDRTGAALQAYHPTWRDR